jgi:hypothetical protein
MHTTLAIRCRTHAPLATHDLERWLTRLADELHNESPQLHPRLSRLTPARGRDDSHRGWLLELELPTSAVGATHSASTTRSRTCGCSVSRRRCSPLTSSRAPELTGAPTRPRRPADHDPAYATKACTCPAVDASPANAHRTPRPAAARAAKRAPPRPRTARAASDVRHGAPHPARRARRRGRSLGARQPPRSTRCRDRARRRAPLRPRPPSLATRPPSQRAHPRPHRDRTGDDPAAAHNPAGPVSGEVGLGLEARPRMGISAHPTQAPCTTRSAA